MRAYLSRFLDEFQYPEESIPALLAGYDGICTDPEAAAGFDEILATYRQNYACNYTALLARCDEVAALCGYADPLYFSRVFRREVGVSPSAYRCFSGG